MLHTLLYSLNFNGTGKMKLAMLAFLYCGDFVKNAIAKVNMEDGY